MKYRVCYILLEQASEMESVLFCLLEQASEIQSVLFFVRASW